MSVPARRTTAMVAGAVACAACAMLLRSGEARVAESREHTADVRARIAIDQRFVERQHELDLRHIALQRNLRGISRSTDPTVRVASFIRDVAVDAASLKTRVVSITPAMAVRALPRTSAPMPDGAAPADASTAFDIALDGEYPRVLATIRTFSTFAYPADVSVVSIARTNPHAADATVRAVVRATLSPLWPDGAR